MLGDKRGNIGLTFALLAPVLLAAVGIGLDYNRLISARTELQEIADSAAIAGARQYFLQKDEEMTPVAVSEHLIASDLERLGVIEEADYSAQAVADTSSVTASISRRVKMSFPVTLLRPHELVSVTATAQARGGANICVIGLDADAKDSILMTGTAKLSGKSCAVYANSTNAVAIGAYNSARMSTAFTCSGGGFGGTSVNYDPMPLTDCPAREDPLAARIAPTVGACNHNKYSVSNFTGTLQPGVYCGGLAIMGASQVQFAPGIYVIKDGDMEVLGTSRITGDNVGFYFTGNGSDLFMNDQVTVEISGPISGTMAGILIWQEPSGKSMKVFEVASNNVKKLVGTIYIPNGKFLARANAPVAESSAYTAIVAKKIELLSGVNLVLNTN